MDTRSLTPRLLTHRRIRSVLELFAGVVQAAAAGMMGNAVVQAIDGRFPAVQYLSSMVVIAALWLLAGTTLLAVLSWLGPLVLVVALAPLLPPQLAVGGYGAGVVWLVLITFSQRANDAWRRVLRRVGDWIFGASLPAEERQFYRDLMAAYASARQERTGEASNHLELAQLEREHVRDLERLEGPNPDWQRVRLVALQLARRYLEVLEGRATFDKARFDRLVDERDETLAAVMARRSPVQRVLRWRLRRPPK